MTSTSTAGPVSIGLRRAAELTAWDVIRLRGTVLTPVRTSCADGSAGSWSWQRHRTGRLPGATVWRTVYQVGDVHDPIEDTTAMLAALGGGFTAMELSADEPGQAQPYRTVIVAVGEYDLVEVQLCQPALDQSPRRYTVIGLWADGRPVPVGVVAGAHHVDGGDTGAFQGLWAQVVQAGSAEAAQQAAVARIWADADA